MYEAKCEWQVTKPDEAVVKFAAQVAEKLSVPQILVQLAYQRGYQTEAAISAYLTSATHFHDPFLMHDMAKAVDRLMTAVSNGERILVYGDYDADGITSTTILMETLEMIGAQAEYYLPNRFEDGYGPNVQVYDYYIKQGVDLILTCDNGVAGHEAIAAAQAKGVDVIVTDHHELPADLPPAFAIVHPRHPEGAYPFGDLAGAGVALKLATALLGDLPAEFLDIAAIGTVADLVSLTDENRTIVQQGLKQLQQTDRIGLQTFFKAQKIEPGQINEDMIGFVLGPRLNALGRLGDAAPGVELLTGFDPDQAAEIVALLEATNNERRRIVDQITAEATARIGESAGQPIIILAAAEWHQGVLGIVASRLVEKFQRPAILFSFDEETGIYKGSGRSIAGLDLFALLEKGRELAAKFGGHAMAAGMSVAADQFTAWQQIIQAAAADLQSDTSAKPPLMIDQIITAERLTLENIDALAKLRPFGTGNPKPLFLLERQKLKNVQQIGKDSNTLKLTLATKGDSIQIIGFGQGGLAAQLQPDDEVDLVVTLSVNEWNGTRTPQASLIDMAAQSPTIFDLRAAKNRQAVFSVTNAYYVFENQTYAAHYQADLPPDAEIIYRADLSAGEIDYASRHNLVIFDCPLEMESLRAFITAKNIQNLYLFAYSKTQAYLAGMPTREQFALVYKYLKTHGQIPLANNFDALAKYLNLKTSLLELIVAVFVEQEMTVWQAESLVIQPVTEKRDLMKSPLLEERQQLIKAERFLLYNDIETIKQYFFQEDKE